MAMLRHYDSKNRREAKTKARITVSSSWTIEYEVKTLKLVMLTASFKKVRSSYTAGVYISPV